MAENINIVILQGRVGKDPMTRTLGETATASFTLATSRGSKDNAQTTWHNIVTYRQSADFVGKYVRKGDLVSVVGEISNRKWTDKDGQDHYVTEIVAQRVQIVASKNHTDGAGRRPEPQRPNLEKDQDDLPFVPSSVRR